MGEITTRCPSCGCQTLFIGSAGHLVCSLIDCPCPGVERMIANLQAKASRYDAIVNLLSSPVPNVRYEQPVTSPCDTESVEQPASAPRASRS